MRSLRWALFGIASLSAALGLLGLWIVRYACTDPRHGCAMMIPGALLFLVLSFGLALLGVVVWLIDRSRDRPRAA
jgi:hypothetical protein